jgi:hypothetical protein
MVVYTYAASENKIYLVDAAVYQMWVDTDNPKKDYYVLIPDPPGPDYTWDGTEWVAPPAPVVDP